MPYTPPSQQSPAASRPESPVISRNQSYAHGLQDHGVSPPKTSGPRPGLPRSSSSTSYLHRHRRSPSIQAAISGKPSFGLETHDSTLLDSRIKQGVGNSIRQSPPPVNDLAIPTGAVISPPDSGHNSSDEEEGAKRGRDRKLENLAELQAAISIIEQHRDGSPENAKAEIAKARQALGLLTIPTNILEAPVNVVSESETPLTKETRKISHSRSATESAVIDIGRPSTASTSPDRYSDSDVDEVRVQKPPMLRKKSGELVRPALRPASAKRRPSSMPGTPTYSKAVHFDSHLEHVRTFLQVDRPLAVSANSSPVDTYENEVEFPFGSDSRSREPPWQWEIKTPNFPQHQSQSTAPPIRVERVFLSTDNKTLIGSAIVKNLAFQKFVVARFTLDYWKTTSEVTAEYSNDVRRAQLPEGCDRFNFNIKLEDLANLESKTLFFCVRYNVNGQEFWDSNGNVNYQVDFAKKPLPQHGKSGMLGNASRPLSGLPKSRPSPPMSSGKPRPKTVASFDDFAHGFSSEFTSFPQPAPNFFIETPLRFRNKAIADPSPAPALRNKVTGQAFGTRYDFDSSLSAAKSGTGSPQNVTTVNKAPVSSTQGAIVSKGNNEMKSGVQTTGEIQKPATADFPKPAALTSAKPALESQSYNDLINKYCFVRSKGTQGGRALGVEF